MRRHAVDHLAVDIARRLTGSLGAQLPRDVNQLARTLGACDVLYRTTIRHGYTEWTSRGPAIQIALSNTDGRRRSTLAHECGHLVLDPFFGPPSFRNALDDSRRRQRLLATQVLGDLSGALDEARDGCDLEVLCDRLAVELLLPAEFAPRLVGAVDSLADLRRVATALRVSLAMLVIRLNEFGGRHALLHLERTAGGSWLVSTAIGVPEAWRGRVVSRDFDARALRGGQRELGLETRGRRIRVVGDIDQVSAHRAIAMLPCSAFTVPPDVVEALPRLCDAPTGDPELLT